MDGYWQCCPQSIREAYGNKYFEDYRRSVEDVFKLARPISRIPEVIDDMVDAVAGCEPKVILF